MKPTDLLTHFTTQRAAADAIHVTQGAVSQWIKAGRIPWARQLQIERITGGVLKHNPADMPGHLRETIQHIPAHPCAAAAIPAPEDGYRESGVREDGPPPCEEAAREASA